jgi:hypothetical protein
MTTVQSNKSWTARWTAMSDKTRMAVSVAAAMVAVFAVLMCSKAGPLVIVVIEWLTTTIRMRAFSFEAVTFGYLLSMYAVVIALGWAHASRTHLARAQRLPKASGKPPVGAGAHRAWAVSMVATSVAACLVFLRLRAENLTPVDVVFAILCGSGLVWFFLGVVVILRSADNGRRPTYSNSVRVVGVVHGTIATLIGFSAENLSLLVGLWVLMYLLCALEKNELPGDYPAMFEEEQPAKA